MKKEYEAPEIEVIELELEGAILAGSVIEVGSQDSYDPSSLGEKEVGVTNLKDGQVF